MPLISIVAPAGEMPKLEGKLLPENMAQKAINVDLRRSKLEGVLVHLDAEQDLLSTTKTLFRYNKAANAGEGYWFQFDDVVDVVNGQLVDDDWLRVYWTGEDYPRMTAIDVATGGAGPYPEVGYQLGIDPPAATLTAAGPTGEVPEGGQEVTAFYVMTYVSKYGEEGPPCVVSNEITRWDSGTVNLTSLPVFSGNNVVSSKNIYRSETGGSFLYVATVAAATTSYDDAVDTADLGEPIPSVEWDKPNADMIGLKSLAAGFMVGFFGKTLCFSEPNFPHAWPVRYRFPVEHEIVSVVETSQGIIVLTKGKPYIVSGTHPSSMGSYPLDRAQACVSARGVVDMGDYALYPSPDGLVIAGASEGGVVSEAVITAEQWRQYVPSSIHAYKHNERYIGFYDNGVTQEAFSFSETEGLRRFDTWTDCAMVDLEDDSLFFKDGAELWSWQAGATRAEYTYRGKIHAFDVSDAFNSIQVDAAAYPVAVTVYVDGVPTVKSITGRKPHRIGLPKGYDIEMEITSGNEVVGAWLATSAKELP